MGDVVAEEPFLIHSLIFISAYFSKSLFRCLYRHRSYQHAFGNEGRLRQAKPDGSGTGRAFTAAGLAAAVAALSPRAAFAFGNGIPGYDINEKARDAQRKAIKDELGEQKELARLEKEKRRAARAAEEAAAEAARTETTD